MPLVVSMDILEQRKEGHVVIRIIAPADAIRDASSRESIEESRVNSKMRPSMYLFSFPSHRDILFMSLPIQVI